MGLSVNDITPRGAVGADGCCVPCGAHVEVRGRCAERVLGLAATNAGVAAGVAVVCAGQPSEAVAFSLP